MDYRHPNGRGWVLDHAEVGRSAYISKDSVVQGNARVRNARVLNGSCVDEDAQVYGGTLDRAYVGGKTIVAGNPLLAEETVVRCKSITGSPRIFHSMLGGIVEISDEPTIAEVHLFDAISVYGDAMLVGPWEVGGFGRIHQGVWCRPPLYVQLDHAVITECVDNKLMVECRCRSREWWLKFGPKLARRDGWSEKQIEETFEAVMNFSQVAVQPTYAY